MIGWPTTSPCAAEVVTVAVVPLADVIEGTHVSVAWTAERPPPRSPRR